MVFAAGLILIFLGLAMVVPGDIPLRPGKTITARSARWAGALLALFLPVAVVMHFLWKRNEAWEKETPLANAQWIAFGTMVTISLGIVLWSVFGSKKSTRPISVGARLLDAGEAFESVADSPIAPEPTPAFDQPTMPSSPPKKKPGGSGKSQSPFDF